MTQTWWLSFADPDRPKGEQFLGVAFIDVNETQVAFGAELARRKRAVHHISTPVSPFVAAMTAAVHAAHVHGCNPGGEVGAVRIDGTPEFAARDAKIPRNRLLSKTELERLGLL